MNKSFMLKKVLDRRVYERNRVRRCGVIRVNRNLRGENWGGLKNVKKQFFLQSSVIL